jgi:disulfide bond formation protein DsbB
LEYMQAMYAPDGRLDEQRLIPLAIIVAAVGALVFAYTSQYAYGLDPCILCLYQRLPFAVAGVLGLFALLVPRGRIRVAAVALAGAVFLAGSGIAFYHVGVEQHWWVSAASCGGGLAESMSVDQLQAQLLNKPAKACDEVDWALFGISMATYNVAVSLILGGASLWGAWRLRAGV